MEKKVTMMSVMLSFMLMMGLMMPGSVLAQQDDQAAILKMTINLPELQNYYPAAMDGTTKQVTIMQYPVSFPKDLAVSGNNTKVVFMERDEVTAKQVNAFFRFRSIESTPTKYTVYGHYFYNYDFTTKKSEIIEVRAEFEKKGADWKMVKSNVKGVE